MKFVKKYLKFIIGIAVIIAVGIAFFRSMGKTTLALESGDLSHWAAADNERRMAAIKILTAGEENLELISACVTKMSTIDDANEMMVRDAVALCNTGIKLREHI